MSLGCVIQDVGYSLPDTLYDESSININIDNQGNAVMQMIVLKKSSETIEQLNFSYMFENRQFVGFLYQDVPEKLVGTEYFEHKLVIKGIIV